MVDDLIDLEIKLAYQERLIRELDALVRSYVTRLETVERELRELRSALPTDVAGNERPPHY